MTKVITISAKCSDQCYSSLSIDGVRTGEKDGYVPRVNNILDGGDYLELSIDIETGQIVNWKKPDQSALDKMYSGNQE